MNQNIRYMCFSYLFVTFLGAAVLMVFGLAMDGMRHDGAGPGQFNPYYFVCCVPAGVFGSMLLVSLCRLPSLTVIVSLSSAAVAAAAWLSYAFWQDWRDDSAFTIPRLAAILMTLGALATWRLHKTRRATTENS